MFIAGVPAEVGAHALNHWHLRNATSFNGCVKELHINGKLVDFLQGSYGAKGLDERAIFNYCTGLAFRLPPEIAPGRRQFPAATEMQDLYNCFSA